MMVLAGFARRDATGAWCDGGSGMVMSLNYDISRVDDAAKADGEPWRITDTLIWATMAVDMGEITEKNYEEFAERLALSAKVHGTLMQKVVDGELVDRPITVEEVKARIGLKTNVTTTTARAFQGRLNRAMKEQVARELRG
jgi:hypothetical protein